jgi:hypothetical protein
MVSLIKPERNGGASISLRIKFNPLNPPYQGDYFSSPDKGRAREGLLFVFVFSLAI